MRNTNFNKRDVCLACISFILIFFAKSSLACDVCGCSSNANYFGILPQFKQHFVGVRYSNLSFDSKHIPSLSGQVTNSKDILQRGELWGRFYPTKRLQIFAFVPYQVNLKTEEGNSTQTNGLSDISVLANYILINTGDSGHFAWRHSLSIGGGIKAPTGNFDNNGIPSLQIGTGTWDYLFNAIYTVRYKQMGVNVDANFRLNSSNNHYQFGNRLTSSMRFFYWKKMRMSSILPHVGLMMEYAEKDIQERVIQKYTGGTGMYAASGFDVYFRKLAVGGLLALPVNENLNEGLVKTNQRITLQVLYLF